MTDRIADPKGQLELGYAFAQAVMVAGDDARLTDAVQRAMLFLKPLEVDASYQLPMAATLIGQIAAHLGNIALAKIERLQEEGAVASDEDFSLAQTHFANAAKYYARALEITDIDGSLVPHGMAREGLAEIFEAGVLGERDPVRAFKLREEAAEAGWAPSMVTVAAMYCRGAGTEASFTKAAQWSDLAMEHVTDLPQESRVLLMNVRQFLDIQMPSRGARAETARPQTPSV